MSLPAMLVGETVGEILQASQFAKEIVAAVSYSKAMKTASSNDPRTPDTLSRRNQRPNPENSQLRARRDREKSVRLKSIRLESDNTPSLKKRARSRINFKPSSSSSPLKEEIQIHEKENIKYLANRVSPRNRPWARKTVLFPNPLFHSSPTSQHHKFSKTKSPIIARNRQSLQKTPHKFLIRTKSPPPPSSKFQLKIRSPPPLSLSPTRPTRPGLIRKSPKKEAAMAKLRRSFSPSRLANRLVSPLKIRKSVQKSVVGGGGEELMMSGLKQRPISTPVRFSVRRI